MVYTPDNVTEKQINWSYWWLNNIDNFKRFFLVIFAVLVGLLILFNLFNYIVFAFKFNREFSIKNMVVGQPKVVISNTIAPQPLEISEPIILTAGQQSYDVVIPVTNNNEKWLVAKLSYFLTYNDGATTSIRTLMINPSEKTYLTAFNLKSDRKLYNVNLEIIEQRWYNLSRADILPNDFGFSNEKIFTGDNGIAQHYEVDVTNNSLINYWEISWLAVAYSGYQPVAIQEVTSERFESMSTRTIYFNWFNRLPKIDRVEVIPRFDRFDKNLSFDAETPEVKQ